MRDSFSEVVEGDGGIFGYPVDETCFFAVKASGFGARKQLNPAAVFPSNLLRSLAVRIDPGSLSSRSRRSVRRRSVSASGEG